MGNLCISSPCIDPTCDQQASSILRLRKHNRRCVRDSQRLDVRSIYGLQHLPGIVGVGISQNELFQMRKSDGATIAGMRRECAVHGVVLVPDGSRNSYHKLLEAWTRRENASEVDKRRSDFIRVFREFEAT